MKALDVVFMGTPEFAVPSLKALANSEFCPRLVVTQPDKPKGRKKKLAPPIIKTVADELNIKCIQPEDINTQIEQLGNPDVIVVVAYGAYLKKAIRTLPKYGCINLHPSLLPKFRGAAPLNFSLFAGEKYTGNTIFKIVAKMDAGPILFQSKFALDNSYNLTKLSNKLANEGALQLIEVLTQFKNDSFEYTKQNHNLATFTSKITTEMMQIDFNKPAFEVNNLIRGLSETPGAYTYFKEKKLKIIEAEVLETKSNKLAGTYISHNKNGIVVAGFDFDILLKKVQPAGKKIMDAGAFANGARLEAGDKFENRT